MLEKRAGKMLAASKKRFLPLSVGDGVVVPVTDVDRGRSDFRNIPAVVTETKDNGLYTVGAKEGILKQSYSRNQLIPTKCTFVSPREVPEQEVSLREVAKMESLGSGQGYERCGCKSGCKRQLCTCRRKGRLCNSKCHQS